MSLSNFWFLLVGNCARLINSLDEASQSKSCSVKHILYSFNWMETKKHGTISMSHVHTIQATWNPVVRHRNLLYNKFVQFINLIKIKPVEKWHGMGRVFMAFATIYWPNECQILGITFVSVSVPVCVCISFRFLHVKSAIGCVVVTSNFRCFSSVDVMMPKIKQLLVNKYASLAKTW